MYEYDRPSALLISLIDTFIRQTERSLAFFFALFVFVVVVLLVVFGKAALYPTIVGLTGLFLLKIRDIVDGYGEMKKEAASWRFIDFPNTAVSEQNLPVIARDYGNRFTGQDITGIFETLRRFLRIIETARGILSDKVWRRETRRSILRTLMCAKKALIGALCRQYGLSDAARAQIEQACRPATSVNLALFNALLQANGVDAPLAKRAEEIVGLLEKAARLTVCGRCCG